MTEITETICRPKQSWMTAPGIQRVEKQPLDRAIEDVFNVPKGSLTEKHRIRDKVDARNLYRYVMERMLKDDTIAGNEVNRGEIRAKLFKFSIYELTFICNCENHSSIIHARKVVQNLLETDKSFRAKAQQIFDKINNNQIVLP